MVLARAGTIACCVSGAAALPFRPMFPLPKLLAVAAVALCAGLAPAQVQKGAMPPELVFEKVWNDGPATFADMAGKVVVLDFAQTW